VTFDDVRRISLAGPGVEDGTSYGTPALKVRKKLLVRLKEDGDGGARSAKVESGFASDRALILFWRMILSPNRSHFPAGER
jgi:hypothetical protein